MDFRGRTFVLATLLACGHAPSDSAADESVTSSGSGSDSSSASTTTVADADSEHGGNTACPPSPGCLDVGGGIFPCADASECVLVDDCCHCLAIHVDEEPPPCDESCGQTACEALGIGQASCMGGGGSGYCTPAFSCDPALATCRVAPPSCPAGELPAIVDDCWGECIPAASCTHVGDCSVCPDGTTCLFYARIQVVCVDTPPDCPDPPTCACFPGGDPCTHSTDVLCQDGASGPECVPGLPGSSVDQKLTAASSASQPAPTRSIE